MKHSLFAVLITLAIGLSACQKENPKSEYPFDAMVLGVNTDCGIYAIKILTGLPEVNSIVGSTAGDSIFIAGNLPPALQTEGEIISLAVRAPEADELGVCTTMGPSYSWLVVVRAKKK
jgi:hypothetical protein